MFFGTLAALSIARGGLAMTESLSAAIVAPIMLPHIILAIGMYPVMVDLGMSSSYLAVIISHTVIGSPLVFITVTAAMKSYSHSLELAAMVLGANPWQTFWKVSFPMLRSGILTGGILAFASSFDELVLALFLTGPDTRTLPRLIWEQLNDFSNPTIAAVASLIIVLTLVLLGIVGLLLQAPSARGTARSNA
jgi:ABC-type spermidine/putrescine transport system permease subunit II